MKLDQAKQDKAIIKAVAYCRFSSDLQREESIDAQLAAIRAYAAQNNMTIVREYIDKAKSATTDQRPDFQRMIKDSAKGEFAVIIVHKLDRFSRNKYDFAIYKRQLKQNEVGLHSVMEHLDGSPESVILESLLEGMSQYYSMNLAREVSKGHLENAKKGKSTGGLAPFGFRHDPATKMLVLHETEAEGVRLVFDMVLSGHSYHDIIRALNERGYKTRGGRPFGINSLYSLLRQEKYRGCYTYNKFAAKDERGKRNGHRYKSNDEILRVEGGCPRIVSDEDFFAVQRKMDTRQQPKSNAVYREKYLLTGKIFCGLCGGAYVGSRRKRGDRKTFWVYYSCNQRNNSKGERCKNKEISRDYIEDVILKNLSEAAFSNDIIPRLTKEYNNFLRANKDGSKELKLARWRLTKLNNDLDDLTEILIQTKSKTLGDKLMAMEEERQELETAIYKMELVKPISSVTEKDLERAFKNIRQKLEDGNLENIRQIIEVYVERIEVFPDRAVIQFNYLPKVMLPTVKGREAAITGKESLERPSFPAHENMGDFGGEGGI